MIISIGTDQKTKIVDELISQLKKRDYEIIYYGPKDKENLDWTQTTINAVKLVLENKADEAIVLCGTGTGASIAANKFNGIRAALCNDSETAAGARKWNDANVLALSLNNLNFENLNETLDSWFTTKFLNNTWNKTQINILKKIESNN